LKEAPVKKLPTFAVLIWLAVALPLGAAETQAGISLGLFLRKFGLRGSAALPWQWCRIASHSPAMAMRACFYTFSDAV
jgi:hypothetical protein